MGGAKVIAQVRRWARVRNGLRAGLAGVVVVLAAALVGLCVGTVVPAGVWFAVPVLAAGGGVWPLRWDRVLLRAGRRLGVGERLAALAVAARRGAQAFVEPLVAEVESAEKRPWRLVVGPAEVAASALACGLAVAVWLFPLREPPPPADVPVAGPAFVVEPSRAEPGGEKPERPAAIPSVPFLSDLPGYSPYQDLLPAVLGLEGEVTDVLSEEEILSRLAAEEGLLRRIVERVAAAAPGGISPSERAELAPLVERVGRRDLRERVAELLDQGDEEAAEEAAQAVEAVVEAAERAAGEVPPPSGGPSGSSQLPVPIEGLEPDHLPEEGGVWSDIEGDGGRGEVPADVPGAAGGDPLEAGPEGEWGSAPAEVERVPSEGSEGPQRSYLVPAIPGEPPPTSAVPSAPVPSEVELVLRTREIPFELRDLVRHYFELIGGNP